MMKNSERAKQAYEFEQIVREAFKKCHAAAFVSHFYSFDSYELSSDGVDITSYDYRCGGDFATLYVPYVDLDDMDAFIIRRQAEDKEMERRKEENKLAAETKKKAKTEQQERATYLKLKEKYEKGTI
jgi:hypothetical protein